MSKPPRIVKITCWLLCIVLGAIILIYAKDFLLPIVIGSLLSFLLYPLYNRLIKWKVPAILSVILTMLVVVLLISVTTFVISTEITTLVNDIGSSSAQINAKVASIQNYISNTLHVDDATLAKYISIAKDKLVTIGGSVASGAISTTTNFMSTLVMVIIYIFCFLLYNHSFREFAFTITGEERHDEAASLINNIQKLVQNYLIGLITVIIIIGTLNSVGFLIIGVDHAIFFAFFAAMLTIIPYIGISIGGALPIIYLLLTKDSVFPAVGVVGVLIIVQFLESNFITPKVVGSRVSVNPFVAIVALLIGGELWGLIGMALSIPLTAILKVMMDARPNTKPIGYFLGSEFTHTKATPVKAESKQEEAEKK